MKTILVTTATTMANAHSYALDQIELLLGSGSISALYILEPLAKSRSLRRTTLSRIDARFKNHILFPLENEKPESFIRRICFSYDVTHVVDMNTETTGLLGTVVRTPALKDIFVNKWISNNQKDWHKINRWLIKTAPQFTPTNGMSANAFSIIDTGYAARRE